VFVRIHAFIVYRSLTKLNLCYLRLQAGIITSLLKFCNSESAPKITACLKAHAANKCWSFGASVVGAPFSISGAAGSLIRPKIAHPGFIARLQTTFANGKA